MTPDIGTSAVVLEGETDVTLRRDFAHPPAKVWRALTEPALIRVWVAEGAMTECLMDARPGGSFLYAFENFTFTGAILTMEPPHRMTHVESFSLDPGYRVEVSTRLDPKGAGTRMTVVMRYADAVARAAAMAAGFTEGLGDVYGRIDGLDIAG